MKRVLLLLFASALMSCYADKVECENPAPAIDPVLAGKWKVEYARDISFSDIPLVFAEYFGNYDEQTHSNKPKVGWFHSNEISIKFSQRGFLTIAYADYYPPVKYIYNIPCKTIEGIIHINTPYASVTFPYTINNKGQLVFYEVLDIRDFDTELPYGYKDIPQADWYKTSIYSKIK